MLSATNLIICSLALPSLNPVLIMLGSKREEYACRRKCTVFMSCFVTICWKTGEYSLFVYQFSNTIVVSNSGNTNKLFLCSYQITFYFSYFILMFCITNLFKNSFIPLCMIYFNLCVKVNLSRLNYCSSK